MIGRNYVGSVSTAQSVEGLKAYMTKIYSQMGLGLMITAAFAYITAQLSFDGQNLTELGTFLFNSPFKWVLMLAPLGVVMFLSFRIMHMSESTARSTFYGYAAINGISLAVIFLTFAEVTIVKAFLVAAIMFGTMSIWGYTTKRDLTSMGSFLMMGMIGVIIASLVNIFMQSTMMEFILSFISVILFTGLTAYDTQNLKEVYYQQGGNSEVAGKIAIFGALTLYIDFIGLFLNLLQLMKGGEE